MKLKGYFIILVSVSFSQALEEGSLCVSSLGWNGICLLSYECSSLGSKIENGYSPELCNTTGPVICCPREKSIPVTEPMSEDNNYQIVAAEQQQRPLFTPVKYDSGIEKKRKVPQIYMRSRRRRPTKKRHPHILVKTYDDVNSIRIRTRRVKPVRRKRKPSRKANPFSSQAPLDFKLLAKHQLAKNAAILNTQFAETSLQQEIAEAHRSGDEEAVLLLTDMSHAQASDNPSRSSTTHRISQLMCETYGELVSETVAEFSKSGIVPVKSEQCSASASSRSSFVMLGEYPHVAGLGYSDASNRVLWGRCSGALISDQFVITAAHCTHSPIGKPKSVALGGVNLGSENIISISEVIRHPSYNRTTFANNLALLRLAKIPKLTDSLRPACLPSPSTVPKSLIATYWSKNEEIKMEGNKTKKFSDVNNLSLQKMKMAFVENFDCDIASDLSESFLCAKVNSVRRSSQSCQGKGGDPIQVKNPENRCMYNLLGIAVENICDESVPIAFTKLENFLPWIESIVWE